MASWGHRSSILLVKVFAFMNCLSESYTTKTPKINGLMNSWYSFTTKVFKCTLHLSASPHLNKGEQIIFSSLIPLLFANASCAVPPPPFPPRHRGVRHCDTCWINSALKRAEMNQMLGGAVKAAWREPGLKQKQWRPVLRLMLINTSLI